MDGVGSGRQLRGPAESSLRRDEVAGEHAAPDIGARWIGKAVPRREDERLLRGRGEFVGDLAFSGAEAAILRSPHAHALIHGIDASGALAMPGVRGVFTGTEARSLGHPLLVHTRAEQEYFPIAVDRVRYVGEPVVVVVATTLAQAEDALAAIEVDYEPLPIVVDIDDALAPETTLLHPANGSNVVVDETITYGEVEGAFARADRIVRGEYRFPKVSSTPIETYGVIADWGQGDPVTVWANFQGPFSLHVVMARGLGIEQHRLRLIVPPDIGGGFGIKISIYPYVVLMALVSRHVGTRVRWIEDRSEALAASSTGTARKARVEAAVTSQGHVLGWRLELTDSVGAYIRAPEPGCLFRATGNLTSAYRTPAVQMHGRAVVTNVCPTGPNRGYGVSSLYFAMERVMDRVAAEVGLDPVEVRMRNLVPPEAMPYETPSGGLYDSGDYPGTLQETLRLADYEGLRERQRSARKEGRWFGVGVAVGVDPAVSNMGYIDVLEVPHSRGGRMRRSGGGQGAHLSIDAGGGVTVNLSTCAQGQGHETVAAQMVAEALGIAPDDIQVVAGMDTATRNWTVGSGAYASRFAATGAAAVNQAAVKLRDKLCVIAAHLLEASPEDVLMTDGRFAVVGDPDSGMSLRAVAGLAHWDIGSLPEELDVDLSASGYVTLEPLQSIGAGKRINSSATYGLVANVAAVEVDPVTLEVRIEVFASVHDVGRVLHPGIVEGQVYGATLHGIGAALYEEIAYDPATGEPMATDFRTYPVPTAVEAPTLRLGHMASETLTTQTGAKGVGEGATEVAPAVIANAVADALGVDVNQLPLTPDRILELIQQSTQPRAARPDVATPPAERA